MVEEVEVLAPKTVRLVQVVLMEVVTVNMYHKLPAVLEHHLPGEVVEVVPQVMELEEQEDLGLSLFVIKRLALIPPMRWLVVLIEVFIMVTVSSNGLDLGQSDLIVNQFNTIGL